MVKAADDRLAQDIMVLDVRKLTPVADYFIIMHARNDRQLDAIVQEMRETANEHDYEVKSVEGKNGGKWILMDMNDIILHIFHYSERANYNLEKIWEDAPMVDVHEWVAEP